MRNDATRLALPCLALAGMLVAAPAAAQEVITFTDEMDFDRPESWGLKWVTSLTLLTGLGVPDETDAGSIDVGIELQNVPHLSTEERRIGFNGTKVEDLNRLSIFGRPRIRIGLPADFSLDFAYVPPVELKGVKANLFNFGIGRPVFDSGDWRVGARFHGLFGTMKGDLTCTEDEAGAGNDPSRNPFNCLEASDDETKQRYLSLEWSVAYEGERVEPHFGLAANYMDLEFQVNSRYGNFIDRTLLLTDGYTYAATVGVGFQATERIRLAGELFYSPLDVVRREGGSEENDALLNLRFGVTYRLRKGSS